MNYGDGETQTYAFDPMGNRTSKSDTTTGTVTESYTYNHANMLLTRGSNSYTNDNNGNTLTGGGRTNTWDGENRLTQRVYNGTTSSFTYGADGLRRRSVTGANTTDYVLDGDNAVRTLLNGAVDKTWLHGARGPEYERTGSGNPLWYLYDGLGSVLGTVDGSGNLVNTRKYDVYGAVRASTGGSGPKHKFVGALGHPSEDETGLVYMRARYMDPVAGRFASEDPQYDGANWFTYVSNNPVGRVDQTGKEESLAGCLTAMAIGAVLGGIKTAVLDALLQFSRHGCSWKGFHWNEFFIALGIGALMGAVQAGALSIAWELVQSMIAEGSASLGLFGLIGAHVLLQEIALEICNDGVEIGLEKNFE